MFTTKTIQAPVPPQWAREVATSQVMHRTIPEVARLQSVVMWFGRPQPSILQHYMTE
jgi:hypothetical protein